MAAPNQSPKVIAYYTPPKGKDGIQAPTQKYEMWQVDYAEASAKTNPEWQCWSLTPPKAGVAVEDNTPKEPAPPVKSNPTPAVERT